jgi:hypothetical protein
LLSSDIQMNGASQGTIIRVNVAGNKKEIVLQLDLFIMLIKKLVFGKMIIAVLIESCFLFKLLIPFIDAG